MVSLLNFAILVFLEKWLEIMTLLDDSLNFRSALSRHQLLQFQHFLLLCCLFCNIYFKID